MITEHLQRIVAENENFKTEQKHNIYHTNPSMIQVIG
jgi:hypothetical protein